MKYPKRSQYKHTKSQYRVRNWAEYEAGLQKRGDVIVWLSDDAPAPGEHHPAANPVVNIRMQTSLSRRL